jgi:hypothetical protein
MQVKILKLKQTSSLNVLTKCVAGRFARLLQGVWLFSLPDSCKVILAGSSNLCVSQFARFLQNLWPLGFPCSCKVCGQSVCQVLAKSGRSVWRVLAKSLAGKFASFLQSVCGQSVCQQFPHLLWYPNIRLNIPYEDIPMAT